MGVSWGTLKKIAAKCRKSGAFSTLPVPPKLLRENLAHDCEWQEDTCHSQDIAIYFTQCKMTHQTSASVIQKEVGNEES